MPPMKRSYASFSNNDCATDLGVCLGSFVHKKVHKNFVHSAKHLGSGMCSSSTKTTSSADIPPPAAWAWMGSSVVANALSRHGAGPPVAWPAALSMGAGNSACRSVLGRTARRTRPSTRLSPGRRPSYRPGRVSLPAPGRSAPIRLRAACGKDRYHRGVVLVGDVDGHKHAVRCA